MSSCHDVVRVNDGASTEVAEIALSIRVHLKRDLEGFKIEPQEVRVHVLYICHGFLL